MNISSDCPRTLAEALIRAEALLTDAEREVIQTKPLVDAGWSLHMTFGHRLRNELCLWGEDANRLFGDINQRMPEYLAVDADTASTALMDALWYKYHVVPLACPVQTSKAPKRLA